MGLYSRLLDDSEPGEKIPVHVWSKLFEQYKRSRIGLQAMLDAYGLTDKTETIAQVVTGTNKLGLSISHTWADDDGVYFTTTGTLPAPFDADDIYYVRDSNPSQGTIKLASTKGGTAIDITTQGTGTHTLNRIDADVIHWEETRLSVTSPAGSEDIKLRRIVFDEKAEGILEVAEEGIAYTTVAEIKTELEQIASWLTVT